MSIKGGYSPTADTQLDAIEKGPDADLYNAVLDACELIFTFTGKAQSLSSAITTKEGVVMVRPVAGHPPYKVYWTSKGPRIEAVFPHP